MGKKRKPVFDMSWQEMGIQMLATEDLDPVYVMLRGAVKQGLDRDTLKRFMLAYWCFYNCGVAAYIAESHDFYGHMWRCIAARVPRGMERRYFWGKQANNAIQFLEQSGTPEHIVDDMCNHTDFWDVYNAVCAYTGFGPWMGWKIADMAETVLRYDVDFSTATLGIYKDPVAGAAVIRFKDRYHPITDNELGEVVDDIITTFKDVLAPPNLNRPVNIQEAETILCKYKAHVYGSYPLNNDTIHLHKAMREFKTDLGDHLAIFIPYVEESHG